MKNKKSEHFVQFCLNSKSKELISEIRASRKSQFPKKLISISKKVNFKVEKVNFNVEKDQKVNKKNTFLYEFSWIIFVNNFQCVN